MLESGPTEVKRDVKDIESVAKFILKAIGLDYKNDPLEKLSEYLGDPNSKVLIILDNFETIDRAEYVHDQFEDMLSFPNKTLITSRDSRLQRDYPIEVPGMDESEAVKLIETEFQEHDQNLRFNQTIAQKIIRFTGAIPYLMKVAVSLYLNGTNMDMLQYKLLSDEKLIEKLFRSSYEPLSETEKYIFLLSCCLSNELSPEVFAGLLAVNLEINNTLSSTDIYQIIQSIRSRSLLVEQSIGDMIWYGVPIDARNFGKLELEKSSAQIEITTTRDMYQRYFIKLSIQKSRSLLLEALTKYCENQYDKGIIIWFDSFLVGVSVLMLEVKRLIAFYRLKNRNLFDYSKIQIGFEDAITYFPDDKKLRFEYSEFAYNSKKDIKLSLTQLNEALRIDKNDTKIVILCAKRFNEFIRMEKQSNRLVPPNQRQAMSELVIQALQKMISDKHSSENTFSQLYWIFINRGQVKSAIETLEQGILVFPRSALLIDLKVNHRTLLNDR